MDTEVRIRKAEVNEAEEIAELNQQFQIDVPDLPWDKVDWVDNEIKHENCFVLKVNDRVTGAMCLKELDDELYIETIAIRPDAHGSGWGRKFVEFAKQTAVERGLHNLAVESYVDYGLEQFYTKCGFGHDEPYIGTNSAKQFYRFKMKF